ncbi:MAG: hypothetical protein ABH828_01260 [archaeon]
MIRKIIKQKTAYTITLPIKWVREHNLNGQDEIEMEQKGSQLTISTDKKETSKGAKLNLEKGTESYYRIMIENHYLKGYNVLNVSFQEKKALKIIQETVSNLIGVEIVDQKDNDCKVSETATPTTEEFTSLFNRCISIIKYSLEILGESIGNNKYDRYEEVEQLTKDARRFLLFLTRTIHKNSIIERDEESFLHLLLERLILIQHNQYYAYQKLSKLKTLPVNKEVKKVFYDAEELFSVFVKQLRKQKLENFTKITSGWENIYFDHKLFKKCTEEESIVLYHSMHLSKLVFLISQPNLIATQGKA